MKKLMLGFAAAIAMVASAEVESQNVVGYQNITVKPGFNLISLNFQPCAGESVDIQDLIQNKEDLIAGTSAASSDQIQIWDGTQFSVYFYRAYKSNNPGKFLIGPCWVNAGAAGTKAEKPITLNTGVWFARPAAAPATGTIAVSGQIGDSTKNIQINPGFNMIGSAFPTDIAVNDESCPINWTDCAVAGTSAASSDQIQIWDGTQFSVYFYRAYKSNNPGKFLIGPCWVNAGAAGAKADLTIPAGTGFWYARPNSSTAGALTQTSPIAE